MLQEVRGPLLDEARRSPTLLSDLAGLERYIAESYDARSFVELLQNADDAGAARFTVRRAGEYLLVANDGRAFTRADFESLCRSAASSKVRGTTIGYRGIGFKSVVGFARAVHLFSGALEATFSRERTAREVPEATQVPLVRIPHPVRTEDRQRLAGSISALSAEGFNTIFVFGELIATGIEGEFNPFDATSLLFLKHVRQMELRTDVEAVVTVRREVIDERTRAVRLASPEGAADWRIIEQDGVALAFRAVSGEVSRLEEAQAVVHAFLPTHEPTGIAAKINADFSTDPSRTRVVLDERTAAAIQRSANLIVDLVDESLTGTDSPNSSVLAALVPFSDPRIAAFQRRSFRTVLFATIQEAAGDRFAAVRLRPPWLNPADFEQLGPRAGLRCVPRTCEGVDGLPGFLKFLGAREASIEDLGPGLGTAGLSVTGAADIVGHITTQRATRQIEARALRSEWRLWPVKGELRTLRELEADPAPLARDFLDLAIERAGAPALLQRLLVELTDAAMASTLVGATAEDQPPAVPATGDLSPALPGAPQVERLSLRRWRSAEQQVMELLVARGWSVEDVSRQNVGYDIEGRTPEGEPVYVEAKAIEHPGQPFILTSNEEAVARQRGEQYILALVRQTSACLEVAFIRDPIRHLQLTRQCRQWVWECTQYDYAPERFPFE